MKLLLPISAACALLVPCAGRAQGSADGSPALCARLRAITAEAPVAAAHWGVAVETLDGRRLCGIHEAQLFRPASNAKLLTAGAALALLGPASTVTTTLEATGPVADGILTGDLRLVGAGDGYLSERPLPYRAPGTPGLPAAKRAQPLAALAASVAEQVKHVTGDIVGDDTLWPYEPYAPDWSIDDLPWGYGAPVSPLAVDNNKLPLAVTPGAQPGSAARVTLPSATGGLTLAADVRSAAAGTPEQIDAERANDSSAAPRTLRVFGSVPAGPPILEDVAVGDPALFAAERMKALLEAAGVTVDGVARAAHRLSASAAGFSDQVREPVALPASPTQPSPASPPAAAGTDLLRLTHVSPTLLDDVTVTLKVSQNLHAEMLLRRLGLRFGSDGSGAQGVRVVRQFWLDAGLRPGDFALFDGSGLSGHDLVTPRALAAVLVFAAHQSWGPGLRAALPVGGVDGSLSGRFAGSLKGRVFAKTGTLGESRALSGYLTAASGATIVFSILVDNHLPGSSVDRAATDRIVEAIAAAE